MSVCIGALYWNARTGREQEHVEDRFGFYYTLMTLAVWPTLLYSTSNGEYGTLNLVLSSVKSPSLYPRKVLPKSAFINKISIKRYL